MRTCLKVDCVARNFTTVHTDSRRSDWYMYSYGDGAAAGRPQGHFDLECTTLNYVLPAGRSWPQLLWTGATIQSGRHYERQHLSGILLKYRHRLAAEFVSRCCAQAGVTQRNSVRPARHGVE